MDYRENSGYVSASDLSSSSESEVENERPIPPSATPLLPQALTPPTFKAFSPKGRKRQYKFKEPKKLPPLKKTKFVDLQLPSEDEEDDEDENGELSSSDSLNDFIDNSDIPPPEDTTAETEKEKEGTAPPPPNTSSDPPKQPPPRSSYAEDSWKPKDPFAEPTMEDLLKIGALKLVSFGEDLPNLKGITRRIHEDKFWNMAFSQCQKKWRVEHLSKMKPEYMLLFATGLVTLDVIQMNRYKDKEAQAQAQAPPKETEKEQ